MKKVVIGMLSTNLDRRGKDERRWSSWRPTVSLCQHDDLLVDRFELILEKRYANVAKQVIEDIETVSPETQVNTHFIKQEDPWDFAQVYSSLREFTDAYEFDLDNEEYLVHMTTGTHVAQICWFLLTEARYVPGALIQTSPPRRGQAAVGSYQLIDLDLSKYDQIASRFRQEHLEGTAYLKQGIETRNVAFNQMIEQLEKVSIRSKAPILLMGPTGAGKSQLARQVYELKKQRAQFGGNFVSVNCATLRGDTVSSVLFGHIKGAFTGAIQDRLGLLREANNGLLFLDEIGELGLDEQAMLLHAIEHGRFMPFGSDAEVKSDFQLIAGTNQNLVEMVIAGNFREDLLARLDLWTYRLPSLKQRIEDFEPNLEFEINSFRETTGNMIRFSSEGRNRYVKFGTTEAEWRANFRDLNSSVIRMATLSDGGRISLDIVEQEILVLRQRWHRGEDEPTGLLQSYLPREEIERMDLFDQMQLQSVIQICGESRSMAEAGRRLFAISRTNKSSTNDSHRIGQFLGKFKLKFDQISRT